MDDYESNCIVLRSIVESYLSDINKWILLWHYDIVLPEIEEDASLSYLLNLIIVQLKKILELCCLVIIKNNNIKFVIVMSVRGGTYSWSMFLLENSLSSNYFTKMSITKYNVYQKNMYFISFDNDRDTKSNSSSQFHLKTT